jgi:hypothetical protein
MDLDLTALAAFFVPALCGVDNNSQLTRQLQRPKTQC